MKLRYLVAIVSCLAGCTAADDKASGTAIVAVSNGVNIIVSQETNGLWRATPQRPSAYRRWGIQNAAKDNITAIETRTRCKVDRNTLVSYNFTVRARVAC